jgi:hypothetical protein
MHEVENFIYSTFGLLRCETKRHTAGAKWIRVDEQYAFFEYRETCCKVYCRRCFPDAAFWNRYSYNFSQKKFSVISYRLSVISCLPSAIHFYSKYYCTLTDKDTKLLSLVSSNEASNLSPCSTRDTPSGVPVKIISPGSNEMNCEI